MCVTLPKRARPIFISSQGRGEAFRRAVMSNKDEVEQGEERAVPRYSEALGELESILDAIEHDEVDLDELGAKVERAAELIQLCRDKIESTKTQVRRIVSSLDEEIGA